MLCLCFVFLCLVYPMLAVSLCFSLSCVPYVGSFSVFFFVLCTLCWQFLCVFLCLVYPMLAVSLDLFCFVFLCLVYPMLAVSLDCTFVIAPSVFSAAYEQISLYLLSNTKHVMIVKAYLYFLYPVVPRYLLSLFPWQKSHLLLLNSQIYMLCFLRHTIF